MRDFDHLITLCCNRVGGEVVNHPAVETDTWLLPELRKGKATRRDEDHIILYCFDRSRKILALKHALQMPPWHYRLFYLTIHYPLLQ